DIAEAVQKLPPAPPIPETPVFLPAVEESRDNPTTPDKVWLGYQLFFDKRLSRDGSMSCESCHHPEQAWTSGNATDPKVGGTNKRNAPSMENVAYYQSFYWDGRAPTMEAVSAAARNEVGCHKVENGRDHGRMAATKKAKDIGRLERSRKRSGAKASHYGNDGRVRTMWETSDFMVKGGNENANWDEKLKPSRLTVKD